ncbi:MAG: hypothetical protein JSS50_01525 [Proteobacteria bacterium]|nr:hypothetical protein [Pseudomonadota bacterium]
MDFSRDDIGGGVSSKDKQPIDYENVYRKFYLAHDRNPPSNSNITGFLDANFAQLLQDAKEELQSITPDGTAVSKLFYYSNHQPFQPTPIEKQVGQDDMQCPNPSAVMLLHLFFASDTYKPKAFMIGQWLSENVTEGDQGLLKAVLEIGGKILHKKSNQEIDPNEEIYNLAQAAVTPQKPGKTWAEKVSGNMFSAATYFKKVYTVTDEILNLPIEKLKRVKLEEIDIHEDEMEEIILDGDGQDESAESQPQEYNEPTIDQSLGATLRAIVRVSNSYAPQGSKLGKSKSEDAMADELKKALLENIIDVKIVTAINALPQDFNKEIAAVRSKHKKEFAPYFHSVAYSDSHQSESMQKGDGTEVPTLANAISLYNLGARLDRTDMQQYGMQNIIATRVVYIETVELYAKHLKSNPPAVTTEDALTYAQVKEHLNVCKAQLAALRAATAGSHIKAERAVGSAAAIPGVLIATGGGVALATKEEAAKVALEALNEMAKGNLAQLGEGLAAGNPVLWALVSGMCLGAIGLVVGISTGAEAASHYNKKPEATKYFLQKLNEIETEIEKKPIKTNDQSF